MICIIGQEWIKVHLSRSQMVQYSFLFIWQNNKKGGIWKESNWTVRKYKNIDKTNLTAVSVYFLVLSPNVKKLYLFGTSYNNMVCILIRHLLHRMHKSMFRLIMQPPTRLRFSKVLSSVCSRQPHLTGSNKHLNRIPLCTMKYLSLPHSSPLKPSSLSLVKWITAIPAHGASGSLETRRLMEGNAVHVCGWTSVCRVLNMMQSVDAVDLQRLLPSPLLFLIHSAFGWRHQVTGQLRRQLVAL